MPAKKSRRWSSVRVSQHLNPKFNDQLRESSTANSRFVYRVERTQNTLEVNIGQWLTPNETQGLIDVGISVSVESQPVARKL